MQANQTVVDTGAVLRFFGVKADGMDAAVAQRHAETLLSIPAYAQRWAGRADQEVALFERLQNQLPRRVEAPAGRQPLVPSQDAAPEQALPAAEATAHSALRDLYIRYVDAEGQTSERRITVQKVVESPGGSTALRAWCHERQAERTFLIDRVEEAVDPRTGEIIDDLYDWFGEHTADGPDDDEIEPDEALGATLAVLIYLAQADGQMQVSERKVIMDFTTMALSAMGQRLMSSREFELRLERTDIDFGTFKNALKELRDLPETMRRGIYGVAEAVVNADKKVHRHEREALLTVREILDF